MWSPDLMAHILECWRLFWIHLADSILLNNNFMGLFLL